MRTDSLPTERLLLSSLRRMHTHSTVLAGNANLASALSLVLGETGSAFRLQELRAGRVRTILRGLLSGASGLGASLLQVAES